MRVAIVGSGVSGLVAARELCHEHEITVFEAASRIGGHTHTVSVQCGGETVNVDTGFIVFNEPNYPQFCRLMNELGVASRPTSMSFSVRSERSGLEYAGGSLAGLFAQRRNLMRPSFLLMLKEILRFYREAPDVLQDPDGDGTTVAEWTSRRGYSRAFVEHHLMPLGAALWSCAPGAFACFPIRFLVAFLRNHGMLDVGGARSGAPSWEGPAHTSSP